MRRVYCSPVVPSSHVSVAFTRTKPRPSYLFELSSDIDRKQSGGHWVIAAGPPRTIRWVFEAAMKPPVPKRSRIDGTPVRLYRIPPQPAGGYYGGHFVVTWRFQGAEYHVSLHGYHNASRAKEIARGLIGQMRDCRPGGGSGAARSCRLVFEAGAPLRSAGRAPHTPGGRATAGMPW